MSNTIQIDADYDIVQDSTGNVSFLSGITAVAQNTRTAMAAQRGEQVFATDAGMPMMQTAFNGLRRAAFEAAARQVIAEVDGVTSVDEFEVSKTDNILSYSATINTTGAAITVGGDGSVNTATNAGSGGLQGYSTVNYTLPGTGGRVGPPGPAGPPGPPGTGFVTGPFLRLDKVATQNVTITADKNALGIDTTIAPGVTVTLEGDALLVIL